MNEGLTCDQVREQELIERYVAGTLDEADAEALELHALTCPDCWALIQQGVEIRAAMVAPAVPAPGTGVVASRRAIPLPWFVGLAAAAVLLLSVGTWYATRPSSVEPTSILRGPADDLSVAASWQADGALRVTWTRLPEASTYRIRLTGSTGREVSSETTEPLHEWSPADLEGLRGELTIEVEAENGAGEVVGRSPSTQVPGRSLR